MILVGDVRELPALLGPGPDIHEIAEDLVASRVAEDAPGAVPQAVHHQVGAVRARRSRYVCDT